MKLSGLTVAVLGLGALVTAAPCGADRPGPFRIPRVDTAPRIDGVVDEEIWSAAWRAELPYEVLPAENAPAPVRTEVLVMFDRTSLYVGMRAYDPEPAKIRAHLWDRDGAWDDDWMGVVLDTFNDERRDLLFVVNPFGVQMDTIENWPGDPAEWDAIWESAARTTPWGWSAELRIPFSSIRFQRSDAPQVWGFDAIRGYPRDRFRQMGCFPRDRNNDCYLCQAVKIEGFEDVSPGHNLEVVPALTASRAQTRPDLAGPYADAEDEVEAGVTATWGFSPNMALAATFNPDFSQVEADARLLDVNEPFALFYPEKRPFFMEGADFFATPMKAVYTRMVRDPAWGVKLTGKEGPHTVGAYVVEDDVTNLVFPGAEGSSSTTLRRSSTAAVARYKLDVGNAFTLGLLATARQGQDYRNRVAGFDVDVRLSRQDRIQLQVLRSSTRYPRRVAEEFDQPRGEFGDLAAQVFYTRTGRRVSLWALGQLRGKDFRADLGFMPQVGTRRGETGVSIDWIGTDDTWYSAINLSAKLERIDDRRPGPPAVKTCRPAGRRAGGVRGAGVRCGQRGAPGRAPAHCLQRGDPHGHRRRPHRLRQRQAGAPPPGAPGLRGPLRRPPPAGRLPRVGAHGGPGRPALHRRRLRPRRRVAVQPPLVRPRRPPVRGLHLRPEALHRRPRRPPPAAVHPVPLLLQAQPAHRRLPRLLGQLLGRTARRPRPRRPDALRQARLCLGHLRRFSARAGTRPARSRPAPAARRRPPAARAR